MQFQSETNTLDLVSDVKYWCGIDSTDTTSYPVKDITRNANFALDDILSMILIADGRWQFDDSNQSGTLLDTSIALVSGTKSYALVSTWLRVARVRIKNSAGEWLILPQVDRRVLNDSQLTATAGDPKGYYILGNYIFLDKAPNYASTGGLEVQFQRGSSYFAYTDTTKTPGFATQFHRLVSLYSARDYCEVNDLDKRSARIEKAIARLEGKLVTFYSERNKDMKVAIRTQKDDFGEVALGSGGTYSHNPDGF